MAIALDSTSNGIGTAVTSKSVSHTCAGSDRILFASVTCVRATNGDQISGVTYNGVAMTQIGKRSSQANTFVYLYYLIAPATGANNIVASAGNSSDIGIVAASYTGVKQSAQPDSSAVANGTAASYSASTTVVGSNCWLVGANVNNGGGFAAGSGSTSRGIITFSGGSQNMLVDSNATVGTGSQSLGVTLTNDNYAYVVASFAPIVETSVSVSVLDASADMPAPSLTLSSSVSASVLDASADMPAVAVTLQPVTVSALDATADMPNVSFEQSSSVYVSVLDASADMPAPARNGGLWSFDGRNSTSWTYDSRNIE